MAGTVTAVNGAVGTTVSGGGASSSSSSSSSGSGSATVTGGLGGSAASSSASGSSSSTSFITLAQLSRYKMQVSLSESDIGSVKVGQPATVTVNAASGEEFAARVSQIGVLSSSSGSDTSSAVSYPVTLTLDQTSSHLKAGMSATADIVTSQVTGLAVPSQALTGSTVTVQAADGTQTTQRVQTGVVGDSTTQIVSGLKAGDTLVVRSAAAALGAAAGGTNQLNNAIGSRLGAGGLAGGLGGGAGGGFGGGGGALPRRRRGRRGHAVSATPVARRVRRPVIAIEDVERVYRLGEDVEVRALAGVSLRVARGEFVAIMGSSGAARGRSCTSSAASTPRPPGATCSTGSTSATSPRTTSPICATARSASSFRASTWWRARPRWPTSSCPGLRRPRASRAPQPRGRRARRGGHGRPPAPSPLRALRRPAAARSGRAGDRHGPRHRAGR